MPDVTKRSRPPRTARLALRVGAVLLSVSAATAFAAASPQASRYYEDALSRYEKKDLKGAIIQLKNALQIDRNMLTVQVLLGRALLGDGQPAAAEAAFAEAMRLGVNRAEVVADLAQSLVDQGKQPQLIEDPRFAISGLPPGVQVRLLLLKSSSAADIGDPREAFRLLDQARQVDPRNPDVWLGEVALRIRERRFDEAIVAADKALALAPGSTNVRYQRSQIDHVRGNLKAALEGYGKALAADPAHVESLAARAGILIDLNRLPEAQKDVSVLRETAPSDPRAAFLQALLAERAGDRDLAKKALSEVTQLIDPIPIDFMKYRAQALMLNGLAHYGLGEREKAKPYLEAYQRLDPGGGVAKLLAQILLAEGNVDPAILSLEAYLRVHPADSQAQALLASAHMSQGRAARATSVAREALKREDTPELRAMLGMGMLRIGQVADALKELEGAYARDPAQLGAGATLVGLYIQRGQAPKALAIAQALIKRDPKRASFHSLLGQAQLAAGRSAAAREAFEAAARLDPDGNGPQIFLARLDAQEKAWDKAEARLTQMLLRRENDPDLEFELASVADLRGRPAEAQRWLERAIGHAKPRDYRAALAMVDLMMRSGKPAQALEAAKAAALKAPSELPPQIALARAQLANKDRDGARTTLNGATRLANFEPGLLLEIATLQQAAGNNDGAAYALEKALNGQPDFLPAKAVLADIELRSGRLDQAEGRAREIVAQEPKKAVGHLLLADVAWVRGQRPAALDLYRKAHRIEPSTDTLMRLQGAIGRHEGPAAAVSVIKTWVSTHPNDRTARRELGDAQARAGQFAAARSTYEALLAQDPKDAGLLNDLANVVLQLDPAAALPIADRALAAAPKNPLVQDTVGWVLFRNGKPEQALQLLRDARLRRPNVPTIRFHLAAVLAHTGRADEARQELRAALDIAPQFEGSEEARKLLKSLS